MLTTARSTAGLRHVKALVELIILPLIGKSLAINVSELVIMAIDNHLLCYKTLEAVIMTLNN